MQELAHRGIPGAELVEVAQHAKASHEHAGAVPAPRALHAHHGTVVPTRRTHAPQDVARHVVGQRVPDHEMNERVVQKKNVSPSHTSTPRASLNVRPVPLSRRVW